MFKATVNDQSFVVDKTEDRYRVNDKSIELDITTVHQNSFSILYRNKSYRAEIVKVDFQTKTCSVKINGRAYEVSVKDRLDLLLEKMGMNNNAGSKINVIKAPMPGLIIDLKVKEGDVVKQNDPMLILEAMKMENIIKSPGDGVVKSVKVQKGASVEKNQVLIEF